MKVSGPLDVLKRFKEAAIEKSERGESNPISLQTLYPMPEVLSTVHTGGCHIDGVFVKRWKDNDKGEKSLLTPEEEKTLDEEGGDWYSWAKRFWGSKWGNYSGYVIREGDDSIIYGFQSAWSPPLPGFMHVSENYPELLFDMTYEDEGGGFLGKTKFKNGEQLDEVCVSEYISEWDIGRLEEIEGIPEKDLPKYVNEYTTEEYSSEVVKVFQARLAGEEYETPENPVRHFTEDD